MIGGIFKSTYKPPEAAPSIAPIIMQSNKFIIAVPEATGIDDVILTLISVDNTAIEPSEKSKRPDPRFIDNAKVVIVIIPA